MDASFVRVSVDGNVGRLVMDRPDKRNALTGPMLQHMATALDMFNDDDRVRVVLLSGSGDTFCAGLDLAAMRAMREATGSVDFAPLSAVFARLAHHRSPTVAMVQGAAIAGGCELALHCDIRVGSPAARFAMPLGKLGLAAPADAAERLVETVGLPTAREMLLTGDPIGGDRAERTGLLSRLVEADALAAATETLVQQLAASAPLSLRASKRVLNGFAPSLTEAQRESADRDRIAVMSSQDAEEGLRAFLERRPASFQGF